MTTAFFRNILLSFLCLLCGRALAQTSAQATGEPLELSCQGCRTQVIPAGRVLKLSGPEGTRPLQGTLISGGDSILIKHAITHVPVMVAPQDVRSLTWTRPGYLALGVICLVVATLSFVLLSYLLLLFLAFYAFFIGAELLLVGLLLLLSNAGAVIFMRIGYRRFKMSRWQLKSEA